MGKISVGLNAEFSRSSDKPFEWAVAKAAEMGYKYFEPMVHFGRELMSEAGYFHTVSMFDDPCASSDACDKAGLKISGLQAHGPLGRPDVHGEYIKLAIRVAAEIGVPVVNTDEGIKAKWTTEEEDFVLIQLHAARGGVQSPSARGVKIGLECTPQYSTTSRWPRPDLQPGQVAGHRHQPRHGQCLPLRPRRLRLAGARRRPAGPSARQGHLGRALRRRARQGHRHARRLRLRRRRASIGRGSSTIVRRKCPRDIVFSVECGTPAQAAASLKHLSRLLG